MPQACRCGCVNLEENLFKPSHCRNCLHDHSKRLASAPVLPPRPGSKTKPSAPPTRVLGNFKKSTAYNRAKIIEEIISTERSYVSQLDKLMEYKDMIKHSTFSHPGVNSLFNGIETIFAIHKSFLALLEERTNSTPFANVPMSNLFTQICPFLKAHIAYATNFEEGEYVSK